VHQSHDKSANDLEIHLEDSKDIGRVSNKRSFALLEGVGFQENVQVEESKPKKGSIISVWSKTPGDVEDGQLNHGKDVPVLHLASQQARGSNVHTGIHCSSC